MTWDESEIFFGDLVMGNANDLMMFGAFSGVLLNVRDVSTF